jgi:hypothetical protein
MKKIEIKGYSSFTLLYSLHSFAYVTFLYFPSSKEYPNLIFFFLFSFTLALSLYLKFSPPLLLWPGIFFFLHKACDRHMFCRPRGKKRVVIHLAQENIIPVSVKTGGMESRWSIVPPGHSPVRNSPPGASWAQYNRRFRGTRGAQNNGRVWDVWGTEIRSKVSVAQNNRKCQGYIVKRS